MPRLAFLVAGALATAGVICAAAPIAGAQPGGRAPRCFQLDDVASTRLVTPRQLLIRLEDGRVYRMGFGADCNNLGTQPLSLHPVDNSGAVCGYAGLEVGVTGVGEQCNPTSLSELTRAEVDAIPRKDRP